MLNSNFLRSAETKGHLFMNSRELILKILNREQVSRFPADIWLVPELMEQLKQDLGVLDDLDLYRKLEIDRIVFIGPEYKGPRPALISGATEVNAWGVQFAPQAAGSGATYLETLFQPLAQMDTVDELRRYPWPSPDDYDYERAAKFCRQISREFATIGPWCSLFEVYSQMRGLENALCDIYANADFMNYALDRLEEIQLAYFSRLQAACRGTLDLVFLSDDMGTQQSLLMSVDSFRHFIYPRLKRWCEAIHAGGSKVFFHSDGAIVELIPLLIEAGIDVLNPIQHVCPGMELDGLKNNFGDKLIFHGGVENQKILPFGTPEDVRAEVNLCLGTLGKDSRGYIPCSCHNIQAGTPLENIYAYIDAVKNYHP